MSKLKVTWIKSDIGYADDQKRTIQSLGLTKLNQSVIREDSVALRGMNKDNPSLYFPDFICVADEGKPV